MLSKVLWSSIFTIKCMYITQFVVTINGTSQIGQGSSYLVLESASTYLTKTIWDLVRDHYGKVESFMFPRKKYDITIYAHDNPGTFITSKYKLLSLSAKLTYVKYLHLGNFFEVNVTGYTRDTVVGYISLFFRWKYEPPG